MVQIENGVLTVKISELGAELKSIIKNGVEYIWQGREEVWSRTAPIVFPICGGLKDDKYILDGKQYNLKKHGFARFKTFEIESKTQSSVVFLLREDEETLKSFPFKFEFRVVYELDGSSLSVNYKVNNLSEDTMYFSIGSHEAFATSEGIEEYDLIFPEKETLKSTILDGNLLGDSSTLIIKDSNFLPLYDKYFIIDALVFKDIKSRSVNLRNRKTGKELQLSFPCNDYLVLWHPHTAPFFCIEPWSGLADSIHSDYDITKKEGIIKLDSAQEYNNNHTITIIK